MRSRGQIIPKDNEIPHTKWLVRVYVGREDGRRVYASELVEGTYKQAEKKRTQMLGSADTSSLVKPSKLTLKSHCESWLSTRKDVSPATAERYGFRLAHDVYSSLGGTQLQKVTSQMIRTLYAKLGETKAPRTIRLTHAALTQAFDQAVTDNLILRNPCDGTTKAIAPSKKGGGVSLTPDEVTAIFAVEHAWSLYVRLVLETGMRPGEALALRWSDLTEKGLSVSRTVTVDEHKVSYIKETPKTASSVRVVSITDELKDRLDAHRKEQLKVMFAAGPLYDRAGNLIFARADGQHWCETRARYNWNVIVNRAGVRKVRLYDSRHTHLTWLLESGENPKAVAERSGHANPNVLLNTYAHVLPGTHERMASTFGAILAKSQVKEA